MTQIYTLLTERSRLKIWLHFDYSSIKTLRNTDNVSDKNQIISVDARD